MLSTLILAVSISFSAAVAPDRHVRVAHDGEPVAMSVQSDGSILKVEDEPKAPKPAKENFQAAKKKLEETKAHEATIKEVRSHSTSAVQKDTAPINSQTGEIKPHTPAGMKVGNVEPHEAEIPSLPQGVALLEVAASDPEESWKSAFFFFASLVLIVVLVGVIVSGIYFNREQAAKKDAAEKVSLTKDSQASVTLNDSSSTSDSGEKIAMLFDRVRKSLEDLSDKTPAEQADMAGGQAAPAVNQL